MEQISAVALADWMADHSRVRPQLLDVREPWECRIASLAGAHNVPMSRIVAEFDSLDRHRPVVCLCHHGMRSLQVGLFLSRQGFDAVYNLSGGIHAWATQVDPAMATY
ncbi:MAG: rhodanese-like domain-containing protein [Burkholderiaceae bacterium]|jgi:rhodanese-related sulfurtransferase